MRIIKKILVGALLLGVQTSIYAQSDENKEQKKTKIEDVIKQENIKPSKEKTKIADVVKKEKEKKKLDKESKKSTKKPKRLSLDEKRAILAEKKKIQKIKDEAKAEKLYQEALKDAINSVR